MYEELEDGKARVMVGRRHGLLVRLLVCSTALAVALFFCPAAAPAADPQGPEPPGGIEVVQRQEDLGLRVTLSWNHRLECVAYRVYRAETPEGPYQMIGGVSASTMADFPFFLDDQVTPGKTYYYRVSAMDQFWREGPPSVPVIAKTVAYRRSSAVSKSIIVSLADQRVYFYENGVLVNILRCSTGAGGTPTGNYRILNHRGWVSGCAYWMDWRPNYGMHAWPSYLGGYEENLGVEARSHGCVRLHPLEAPWAYNWSLDGTPFTVVPYSMGNLPLQGVSCAGGTPKPSKTWYFAEGSTGGGFYEYLQVFNPGGSPVHALTTYTPDGGGRVVEDYYLPPGIRQTFFTNRVTGLPTGGHAIKIEADGEMVAEVASYFDYAGRRGGDVSMGATSPSNEWYFSEGSADSAHITFLCLYNPNDFPATATVTYLPEAAGAVLQVYNLPPAYRGAVMVNGIPGVAPANLSIEVKSEQAIVAERTVYFAFGLPNGINGGDRTTGLPKPARAWYLPEGSTANYWDEYIAVFNPTEQPAVVNATFYPYTGPYGYQFIVGPKSRGTLSVDSMPALASTDTPVLLTSPTDIVVERTMYYSRDSRRGGSTSNGLTETSTDWYFAEGSTGGTFDQYIALLNTGDAGANVTMRFHADSGAVIDYPVGVPPRVRVMVHVDEIPGLETTGNSVEIHSTAPITAERTELFCVPR